LEKGKKMTVEATKKRSVKKEGKALISDQKAPHRKRGGSDSLGLTPEAIVKELDRFVVGQKEAKRRIAIAHRDRERRLRVDPSIKDSIKPKNILMVGPTGVGKTEIARRLAQLMESPFVKVEATKFTEVGYIGRDVEQIIRDLLDSSISLVREGLKKKFADQIQEKIQERIIDALVGEEAEEPTRQTFRKMLAEGKLEDRKIDVKVSESKNPMTFLDVPSGGSSPQMGVFNLGDILEKSMGSKEKTLNVSIEEARKLLYPEEEESLINQEILISQAISQAETMGIVFLDEIDKICEGSQQRRGGDVSREGVQRDLLPILDGTTVSTKYGPVKTDHILFIASGAFHLAKPSDLLPELQGRLPISVQLSSLSKEDFCKILTETEHSLIHQYRGLFATEGVDLVFQPDAVKQVAYYAELMNKQVEDIGARRLQTLLEQVLEEFSFNAAAYKNKPLVIEEGFVKKILDKVVVQEDLSRFVL
jgi:ATP-dependent HslUV protease ATP-binding subunit HslU